MPIKPELKEWMDRLPISEEAKKLLSPELEKDDVQNKFFETMVPRSTYSKDLDKKDQEARQQIENERKAALAAKQSYETFQQNEQKKVNDWYAKNNAQLVAEQNQRKAYEAKLADLVRQGLIDPEEATVAKQEFIQQQQAAQPPAETKKYVSKEDLESTIGGTYIQNARNIAKINDIADAHFDLFGTRLSRDELVQATLDANEGSKKVVTIEEVWAKKYGVAEKRAELQKLAEEQRIKAAVEEAVVRDRSERAIEGGNAPFNGLDDSGNKHILSIFSSKDGKHRAMGVSPGVAAATEAWRQGKLGKEGGGSQSA